MLLSLFMSIEKGSRKVESLRENGLNQDFRNLIPSETYIYRPGERYYFNHFQEVIPDGQGGSRLGDEYAQVSIRELLPQGIRRFVGENQVTVPAGGTTLETYKIFDDRVTKDITVYRHGTVESPENIVTEQRDIVATQRDLKRLEQVRDGLQSGALYQGEEVHATRLTIVEATGGLPNANGERPFIIPS
jgi:hypothetical protein